MKGGKTRPHRLSTPMGEGCDVSESLTWGTWSRIDVLSGTSPNTDSESWRDRGTQEPVPPLPAENCFMHQAQEKVSLNERLEKACEPGVDYGECGLGW